jgi:hypothetical protein
MDVVIPGLVAELFADELAPINSGHTAGPGLPGSLSHEHAKSIGYALRAAAHGVAVDWPRVVDLAETARGEA